MAEQQKDPLNPMRKLYRYENSERAMEFPTAAGKCIREITTHIEQHIGPTKNVFHEIISDQVHLDVIIVPPNDKFPNWTLVTSGMSDKPMRPPRSPQETFFAELLIRLPATWKVEGTEGNKEENYWPIRLLKIIARFPHKYGAFLWAGHTLDNGEPPTPWSKAVPFDAAFLAPSRTLPKAFENLEISTDKKIKFIALYPVYVAESAFARKQSANALWKLFVDHRITDVADPNRKSLIESTAAKPSFWNRFGGH